MRIHLSLSLLAIVLCVGCVSRPEAPVPSLGGRELIDRTSGSRAPYEPSPNTSFERTDGADPFAQSPTSQPRFGTAYGVSRTSRAAPTTFQRAGGGLAVANATLYYNAQGDSGAIKGGQPMSGSADGARAQVGERFVSLNVRSAQGKLPLVSSDGRTYVVGRQGDRFTLSVHNGLKRPVEVVLSIDGLDVIQGTLASERKRGYVIDAGETVSVDGFRSSRDQVSAFRFGELPPSPVEYQRPHGQEAGVIGMAVFEQAEGRPASGR